MSSVSVMPWVVTFHVDSQWHRLNNICCVKLGQVDGVCTYDNDGRELEQALELVQELVQP